MKAGRAQADDFGAHLRRLIPGLLESQDEDFLWLGAELSDWLALVPNPTERDFQVFLDSLIAGPQ